MNIQNETQVFQQELAWDFQMKVFWLVWYAMWLTAITAYFSASIFQAAPILANWWVSLIALLWLVFTQWMWSKKEPLNILLFSAIAFLLWLSIAPLVSMAIMVDPMIVTKAFVATAALSFAAWIYWATTHRDMSWMWWFLMIALIWLIIVWVLNIFWPSDTVSLFVSWAWVILFSIFIAYDINTLKHYPKDMAITAAIWLYLSIFNLFQSILSLLLQLSQED